MRPVLHVGRIFSVDNETVFNRVEAAFDRIKSYLDSVHSILECGETSVDVLHKVTNNDEYLLVCLFKVILCQDKHLLDCPFNVFFRR